MVRGILLAFSNKTYWIINFYLLHIGLFDFKVFLIFTLWTAFHPKTQTGYNFYIIMFKKYTVNVLFYASIYLHDFAVLYQITRIYR